VSNVEMDGSQYDIAQSRGVPPVVRWFFVIGVLMIIWMGWISAFGSGTFHIWPASQSYAIDLGKPLAP
jgi:hypothetical protein